MLICKISLQQNKTPTKFWCYRGNVSLWILRNLIVAESLVLYFYNCFCFNYTPNFILQTDKQIYWYISCESSLTWRRACRSSCRRLLNSSALRTNCIAIRKSWNYWFIYKHYITCWKNRQTYQKRNYFFLNHSCQLW